MNLEPIIHSEVNQKDKYHTSMHIYMESIKIVPMNLPPWKEWRHICREWTCGHSGERRGWDKLRKYYL